MDPLNVPDFAQIRFDTSILLKRLKTACENVIEDSSLSLDDKRKTIEEKIEATTLGISNIHGQVTSTLELSRRLVSNFTLVVMDNLEDINRGLLEKNDNLMRFTRAAYRPGVLSRHLDELWDQIPSTVQQTSLLSLTDKVHVHDKQLKDISELTESLNNSFRTMEEELKFPNKSVLAKIFGDSENICKLRKKNDKVWDSKPEEELITELKLKMEQLECDQSNLTIEKITPKGRATPFLKLTFLTSRERRNATNRLNSVKF